MAREGEAGELERDVKCALIRRVADSATLSKAPRLRQLFLYLCEHALERPDARIKENQIGNDIFDRAPDYDTSQDTIVRVQISQLRRKLELYFLSEGISEPVVIELPKGSYTPVFRRREGWKAARVSVIPAGAKRWARILLAAGAAALVVSLAVLLIQHSRSRKPALERFWRSAFLNGSVNRLVLSDGNLLGLTDVLNKPVSLTDYRRRSYPEPLLASIADPAVRESTGRLMRTRMTSIEDAGSLNQLVLLGARLGISWNVTSAPDYRPPREPGNLILLGHRKANPWIEVYESALNFRYEWIADRRVARMVNQAPRTGEQPLYELSWTRCGYPHIAYLKPGPDEKSVLILGGTDLGSTEAAARTVTDETAMARLLDDIGISPNEPIPPFEALLKLDLLTNAPSGTRLVAWRVKRGRR